MTPPANAAPIRGPQVDFEDSTPPAQGPEGHSDVPMDGHVAPDEATPAHGAHPAEQVPAPDAAPAGDGGGRGLFRGRQAPEEGARLSPGKQRAQERKAKAEARREQQKRKRALRTGVRYAGDRRKWLALCAALAAFVIFSVLAFMTAISRPTAADVTAQVDEALANAGRDFPTGEAVMWAGQVARVWGTWDEESPDDRAIALAPFLTSGMDANAGWNGQGAQSVIYASVNPEPRITDKERATIDVTVQVQDGTWRCLALPVYAHKSTDLGDDGRWAFALASNPAPIPCAPRVSATQAEDGATIGEGDQRANTEIGASLTSTFFPGFFAAWGGSDEAALNQYTVSGLRLIGLGGAVSSVPQPAIGETAVYVEDDGPVEGRVYDATVPVTWTVTGSSSQMTATYVVPIRRDGERWLVAGEPRATPQAPGIGSNSPNQVPDPARDVRMPEYDEAQPTPGVPDDSVNPSATSSAPISPKPSSSSSASPKASPSPSSAPPKKSPTSSSSAGD